MMTTRNVEERVGRVAPIDMTPAGFRDAGHAIVDQIADWLERMPDGPVRRDESGADIRRVLHADRGLPQAGAAPRRLLEDAAALLFEHSIFNGHPRFFGYITSSPASVG
jgi:aromatic-L-amino-acid/L-tryptophan decarboxylase